MTPSETTATTNQNYKKPNQEFLSNASDTIKGAASDVRDAAAKAEGKVLGFIGSAREKISNASDSVTQEIRSNPVQSTLIALGAGYLLSMLLRR